ncbi:MAG: zf-HC2 domain-containing protein [Eubacteriales bacterium]|nr:zf-HC2 domain-containing protein [Eubacteriales bacterium]
MNNWLHQLSADQRDLILFDYAEGLLAIADVKRLEDHLSGCDACRDQLAEYQRWTKDYAPAIQSMQRDLKTLSPLDGLSEKIKLAILNEPILAARSKSEIKVIKPQHIWALPSRFRSSSVVRRWASIAAAVVILVGAGLVYQNSQLQSAFQSTWQPQGKQANELNLAMAADEALPADSPIAADAPQTEMAPTLAGEGQARLFMTAPIPVWADALAADFILPLADASDPSRLLTVRDLMPSVIAAIWLDPDVLIAAIPKYESQKIVAALEQAILQLTPESAIMLNDQQSIEALLETYLSPDDRALARPIILQPDCDYLVISIGGH